MAPLSVYQVSGGSAAGVTPTAPGAGTILTNHVAFFAFETAVEAITIPTPGTGWTTWTQVTGSPQSVGVAITGTRLTVFWARATQNDPTMPTCSDSGDHQNWAFSVWSGCETSGNPWDITVGSTDAVSNTSGSATGGTTTVNDVRAVLFAVGDLPDAASTTEFSAQACTNGTSVSEQADRATTSGNGGSIMVASAIIATAGSFGPFTYTRVNAAVKAHLIVALKPPATVASVPSRKKPLVRRNPRWSRAVFS